MTLDVGTKLGRYEIRSQLGAGGMGEVYLAMDEQLRRKVALKLLPAGLTKDEDRVRRFEQEARATSALNHPNILTIYEIGQAEGEHYIASEYVEGETLRHLLARQGKFEVVHTLDTCVQIVSALSAAHSAGVVHRDIKQENVMLRPDRIVKVLDFGLAKLTENKDGGPADSQVMTRAFVSTNPGFVMGTVAYMSPEQVRGEEIDARTDIFSAGVVMYEMLTGKLPFAGKTSSDIMAAVLTAEPLRVSEFNPQVPQELERIISKTLSKDREERYQTAKDLLVDLRRLKKQIDVETELKRSSPFKERSEQATQIVAARATTTSGDRSGIEKKKLVLAIALTIVIGAVAVLGYTVWTRRVANRPQIESIAVLPFVNASGDPNMEYLSDGISESLINSLSQLPNTRVMARTTTFSFKGKDLDPSAIGRQLGVTTVLTGRIVQLGDNLSVQADLVDVSDGSQLWGERFNRKATDLLAIQEEITRRILDKLSVRLSDQDSSRLTKRYTDNIDAYRAYLRGRYEWNKRTVEGLNKALRFFNEAIALDPSYALAHAGMADTYALQPQFGNAPFEESLLKAKAASLKAVEFDASLAEANIALANVKHALWDWQGVEEGYKRGLALNQNYATGHQWYSEYLVNMGRLDEGEREIRLAQQLDPMSLVINVRAGMTFYFARQYDRAERQLRDALQFDPNFILTNLFLSNTLYKESKIEESIPYLVKGFFNSHSVEERSGFESAIRAAFARSGTKGMMETVRELLRSQKETYAYSFLMAHTLAVLGDKDGTFLWLNRAAEVKHPGVTHLNVDPMFDGLRDDPRFGELMKRVGITK